MHAHEAGLRYTFGMQKRVRIVKTTVSIERQLFLQVGKIAREQKLPRSRVFVLALEAYVAHYQNRRLLDPLKEADGQEPDAAENERLTTSRRSHRRIVEGE